PGFRSRPADRRGRTPAGGLYDRRRRARLLVRDPGGGRGARRAVAAELAAVSRGRQLPDAPLPGPEQRRDQQPRDLVTRAGALALAGERWLRFSCRPPPVQSALERPERFGRSRARARPKRGSRGHRGAGRPTARAGIRGAAALLRAGEHRAGLHGVVQRRRCAELGRRGGGRGGGRGGDALATGGRRERGLAAPLEAARGQLGGGGPPAWRTLPGTWYV